MAGTGEKLVVVGAGPVGSLAALYAAKRGYDVHLYDLRADPRHSDTTPLNFTKSINLALSERGIHGIRSSGHEALLDTILAQTIPMHGRMIHTRSPNGSLSEESQAYDVHGRFLRSADRGGLNVCLLNELDKLPNVNLHFLHKLTGADFNKKKAWFEDRTTKVSDPSQRQPETEISFDLMLGCDGAHSAVRYHLMKFARMNYQQEYIDCLWCEFAMPPRRKQVGNPTTGESTIEAEFQISPDHLHIWPAGSFMFIALPNLDRSFVCTLFGPASLYSRLETATPSDLTSFFDTHFPGVTSLIPPDDLHAQFHRNPHLPLINIKCTPYHHADSVVILGDAAHAMVPFYGQGMNAGLESVRVLFAHLDDALPLSSSRRAAALAAYTAARTPDAHAVADLALGNYHEMRAAVTSPLYKLRKFVEERLDRHAPALGWATQYARVSFSNLPYGQVRERARRQKRVLQVWAAAVAGVAGAAGLVGVVLAVLRVRRRMRSGTAAADLRARWVRLLEMWSRV